MPAAAKPPDTLRAPAAPRRSITTPRDPHGTGAARHRPFETACERPRRGVRQEVVQAIIGHDQRRGTREGVLDRPVSAPGSLSAPLWLQPPVDLAPSGRGEGRIRPAERPRPEEGAAGERRGMGGGEDGVAGGDERRLGLCVPAPEQEDDRTINVI